MPKHKSGTISIRAGRPDRPSALRHYKRLQEKYPDRAIPYPTYKEPGYYRGDKYKKKPMSWHLEKKKEIDDYERRNNLDYDPDKLMLRTLFNAIDVEKGRKEFEKKHPPDAYSAVLSNKRLSKKDAEAARKLFMEKQLGLHEFPIATFRKGINNNLYEEWQSELKGDKEVFKDDWPRYFLRSLGSKRKELTGLRDVKDALKENEEAYVNEFKEAITPRVKAIRAHPYHATILHKNMIGKPDKYVTFNSKLEERDQFFRDLEEKRHFTNKHYTGGILPISKKKEFVNYMYPEAGAVFPSTREEKLERREFRRKVEALGDDGYLPPLEFYKDKPPEELESFLNYKKKEGKRGPANERRAFK